MDLSNISPVLLLASLMVAATPILLAAIGELMVERAGVLNLGVEGMMITGAIGGFMMAVYSAGLDCSVAEGWRTFTCRAFTLLPAWVNGFILAAVTGALLSALFGILTQYFLSNQVATGLALTLFGVGLASLLGEDYVGIRAPSVPKLDIPVLSDIPVLGPILFQHDPIVYLGLLIVLLVWWFLRHTRGGLILRAVGENHDAAHALGYKVTRIRMLAILFGGACAGLGGAYLGIVRVPQWTEGVTAGAGWIALAIVVFASWRPGRLVTGAYLFGGIGVLQLNLQAARAPIPVEVLSMSPYIATIIALVILSARKSGRSTAAPAALGQPFHASR